MFIVKKPPLTPNIIWDSENEKVLCRFDKGVFKTNDTKLAEKLKELGYEVDGESDEADKLESATPLDESETKVDGESDEAAKPKRRTRKTADK